jgi:hypothetical protein
MANCLDEQRGDIPTRTARQRQGLEWRLRALLIADAICYRAEDTRVEVFQERKRVGPHAADEGSRPCLHSSLRVGVFGNTERAQVVQVVRGVRERKGMRFGRDAEHRPRDRRLLDR